jgi:adenylate kinase
MIFIFLGPPGAGKGTQADLVSKKFDLPHLSTGDILRKKLEDKDILSVKLKEIMDSGNLVSDEILNEIVSQRLNLRDCKNGFILDGYPRTVDQQIFLSKFLESNSLVISKIFDLFVEENIVIKRIKVRSRIENREDDKEEIIKTRIEKYHQQTKPLSDFYSKNHSNSYHLIDGNQEIQNIQSDILETINE